MTESEIRTLHRLAIERDGTHPGVLDENLLRSAIAMPRQTFARKLLHPTLEAAAAAYWFHLVQNHPFVDGNKRAGLISCLAFLLKNGRTLDISSQNLVEITLKIARGNLKKPEIEEIIRQNIMPLQRPLI